jgi:hypothetical protein
MILPFCMHIVNTETCDIKILCENEVNKISNDRRYSIISFGIQKFVEYNIILYFH